MKSQYLELRQVADKMNRLANEAFEREKKEAIDWIGLQINLFGLTIEQIMQPVKAQEVVAKKIKPHPNPQTQLKLKDHHGNSFRVRTDEARKKQSDAMAGKKHSEQTKDLLRLESATRPLPRRAGQPARINGLNYRTILEATKALGICHSTVTYRCKNKREEFKDWMLLPVVVALKQA